MEAATWTVIAILATALVGFFVDSRSDRRALRGELGARIDALGGELRNEMRVLGGDLGARIDVLGGDLGARIDAQSDRIDRLVLDVGEIKGDLAVVKAAAHTHNAA